MIFKWSQLKWQQELKQESESDNFNIWNECEKTSRLHESFKKREIILLRAKLWYLHRIQDVAWEKKTQFRKQVSNLIASKLV